MKRQLATIQVIESLRECPKESEKVVIARMEGLAWNVVVKRDDFKPGDKCVYFEVDSILPKHEPWAEFMESRKYRVATMKMRGVVSQGLILPTSIIPEEYGKDFQRQGIEVTEILAVRKYEPPMPKSLDAAGNFPGLLVPVTDEIRLQAIPKILEELRAVPFYISTKCDGMSGTFLRHDGEFMVCSRKMQLKPGNNVWWNVAEQYKLEEKIPEGFAVQGEVCGPGIQSNHLGLPAVDLFVFNVYNIKEQQFLSFKKFTQFCAKHGLKTVPIVSVHQTDEERGSFEYTVDEFIALADGVYETNGRSREGIVVRPLKEAVSLTLESRFSFKVISNKFLLKHPDA
jgi:RNA ligase (TIGR02306 family)